MPLLLGIATLILLLWLLNSFTKADPRLVLRSARIGGGIAALIGALALALVGRESIAVPLGVGGLALLGWWPLSRSFGGQTRKSPGQVSRVRTAYLEMELDHDSGAMRGRILAGRLQGASLDALNMATLLGLLGEIDGDSRDLLAAYLDRQQPDWREHAQDDAEAGRRTRAAASGKITEEEAYQILGVEPGASVDDISRAHRSLMKKLHPDQGGSTYLAARVNEAKEVLLRDRR